MAYILGISAFYHDSAACLLKDGKILAAAQEERFSRKKNDPSFPSNTIKWLMDYSGISPEDIDIVCFYDKPLLKFERLLETYYSFAPRGFKSFAKAIPVWIKQKIFIKDLIRHELKSINGGKKVASQILFTEHHLSHAASAFFPSPFEKATILTVDGVGEWATASIAKGEGKQIKIIKEMHFPNSIGLFYSAMTYYCGFKVNSGEYKLMGLAPYADRESKEVKKYKRLLEENVIDIKKDGSVQMNMDFFDYPIGLKMCNDKMFANLLGFDKRVPEEELKREYMELAMATQLITEKCIINMSREAVNITGYKDIVLAGGVALNCVANSRILKENVAERIWIQPAAGDAGGALGAALSTWHIYLENERFISANEFDPYLGPEYSDLDIEKICRKYNANFDKISNFDDLLGKIAGLIADGNVIGWFQGRTEWGPRALGNRSILADPRNPLMQKKLNLKIKYRESFRPFAPSVLEERSNEYFDTDINSPYMLLVADVVESRRKGSSGEHKDWKELINEKRSEIPAVTHIDYSARLQTVSKSMNPKYYELIKKFGELTGIPVLINTSFNVRGEPIVNSPEDAYKCFMNTEMDYLVMGNYLLDKKN